MQLKRKPHKGVACSYTWLGTGITSCHRFFTGMVVSAQALLQMIKVDYPLLQ